jgi:hypothetical protein
MLSTKEHDVIQKFAAFLGANSSIHHIAFDMVKKEVTIAYTKKVTYAVVDLAAGKVEVK